VDSQLLEAANQQSFLQAAPNNEQEAVLLNISLLKQQIPPSG